MAGQTNALADGNTLNQPVVADFFYKALRIFLKIIFALSIVIAFALGGAFVGLGITALSNDSGRMDPNTMATLALILAGIGAGLGAILGAIGAFQYFFSDADPIVQIQTYIQTHNLPFFGTPTSEGNEPVTNLSQARI
jgi:ABC-type multidrug transport system fused ATPase/permease subunit